MDSAYKFRIVHLVYIVEVPGEEDSKVWDVVFTPIKSEIVL